MSSLSVKNLNSNALLARFLYANRTFTGAGGAREVIQSFGLTIYQHIEKGRSGTIPTWSAYDLGDVVLLLIDGIWTPQQGEAILAGASLPAAPYPVAGVNVFCGADALSIFNTLGSSFAGLGKRLIAAGYSYGGVLAEILAALSLAPGMYASVEVATFGSFRPGNSLFAQLLSRLPVVRWMNDNDPLPRFPPHMTEGPVAAVSAPFPIAATWQQYIQPAGGIVLGPGGVMVSRDLPPATIPIADADLLLWLSGIDSGKVAGHSLLQYVQRLVAAVSASKPGVTDLQQPSTAEPGVPATLASYELAVADYAALIAGQSAVGKHSMAYIPVPYRPKVLSLHGSFQVSWMGLTICTCPTKSAARTVAKYLFKWLRVLQGDSTTSISQLSLAWQAFWGVAGSSSAGFDPPFQTSP